MNVLLYEDIVSAVVLEVMLLTLSRRKPWRCSSAESCPLTFLSLTGLMYNRRLTN